MHLWFVLTGIVLLLLGASAQKKIVIAVDGKTNRNPLSASNELLEFRMLSHATSIISDVSLVTHSNWTTLRSIYGSRGSELPAYLRGNMKATELFDNKADWKSWMDSIGLGDYVPRTYLLQERHHIQFPLMLKVLTRRNGRGVMPILNKAQFTRQVGRVIAKGQPYLLEEALMGMGFSEVFSYGSVYKGDLLSMRCLKRTYPANLWHSEAASSPVEVNDIPFVGSYSIKPEEEHFIPCSRELIDVTRTMFVAASPYTGAFCSTLKTDAQGRVKMIEVNTRLCASVADNKELQAVVLVPLSFAVLEDLPRIQVSRTTWTFDPILLNINHNEKEVLQSGGGVNQRKHIVVDKFNHTLKVDAPVCKSNLRHAKCSVDIADASARKWW